MNKFHLIGISGIGMSGLARLLLSHKYQVSGSDLSIHMETENLKRLGAVVFSSHEASNIQEQETTIVYSTAIKEDNPEIIKAKELGCKLWHRSDLLSFLLKSYTSIAITGTHGKTTTSSFLTHVLKECGLDPSYALGGILKDQKTNSAKGTGPHFVLEADESDGSFLKYFPQASIITNLEEDHLDYFYRDLDHLKECFTQYLTQVKDENLTFWCKDCPNLRSLNPKGFSYGFHKESDVRILSYRQKTWKSFFSLDFQGKKYKEIELSMIGPQNALNAAAVFGLCIQMGIIEEKIRNAFKTFNGVKRRSEKVGKQQEIQVIDDYAHHPTEVKCVLKSIRKAYPQRRIIALFQPHRYSRLKYFQKQFSESFGKSSEVWLTDVYSAGEPPLEGFSSENFALEIESNSQIPTHYISKDHLLTQALKRIKPHDVLVTIGAGDITYFGPKLLEALKEHPVKWKIGVLSGSTSPEHHISHMSSKFFLQGLDPSLYYTEHYKIDLEGRWQLEGLEPSKEVLSTSIFESLKSCDMLFPIIHGPHGEDGMIQGFLETLQKPYIGADYSTCALTMNKAWCKAAVEKAGIRVAKYHLIHKKDWASKRSSCLKTIEKELSYPLVIKPVSLGSSIGVHFAYNQETLIQAVQDVLELDNQVLVEVKIKGREFEIALLEGETFICSKPGEILSKSRCYDYLAKYSQDPILKITEADLPLSQIETCQKLAKKIYTAIQGKGFARIDFFINRQGEFIFNEINSMPGCTPKSLFPRMLKASGLTAQEILDQMVINGLYHYRLSQKRNRSSRHFAQSVEYVTQ